MALVHSRNPSPLASKGILLNPSPSSFLLPLRPASVPAKAMPLPPALSSSESASTSTSSSPAQTPPENMSQSLPLPFPNPTHPPGRRRESSPARPKPHSPRRIRFAPLPDPRRSVFVTEQGDEFPLPAVFDESGNDVSSPVLTSFPPATATASPAVPPSSSLLLASAPLDPSPASSTSTLPRVPQQSSCPSSPGSSRRTASPLRSITSSSASTTPTASPSLAKKLFMPFRRSHHAVTDDDSSSRESSRTRDDSAWGIPLGRWSSTGSGTTKGGVPLTRTLSSTPACSQPQRRTQPLRLLNGRIYGASRNKHQLSTTNAFANIRDQEPEFVEWGYGGMGSVKNQASSAGVWSKLQTDTQYGGRGRAPARAGAADDDDDGSGMAWLKKRKEAREKEAREKAEREAKEKKEEQEPETEATMSSASSTASTETPSSSLPSSEAEEDIQASAPNPVVEPIDKDEGKEKKDKEERPRDVVSVPYRAPHHAHSSSVTHTPTLSRASTFDKFDAVSVPIPVTPTKVEDDVSDSESDGEDEVEDDNESEDGNGSSPEDADEDQEAERARKTALGAGVEVVSRHRE